MALKEEAIDQDRLSAAREFISGVLERSGQIVSVQDYARAVIKAAEALPPFTRIRAEPPK